MVKNGDSGMSNYSTEHAQTCLHESKERIDEISRGLNEDRKWLRISKRGAPPSRATGLGLNGTKREKYGVRWTPTMRGQRREDKDEKTKMTWKRKFRDVREVDRAGLSNKKGDESDKSTHGDESKRETTGRGIKIAKGERKEDKK